MVKRGSACFHPSHPQIGRGPWVGVKFIGRAVPATLGGRRPPFNQQLTTDHWLLTNYRP